MPTPTADPLMAATVGFVQRRMERETRPPPSRWLRTVSWELFPRLRPSQHRLEHVPVAGYNNGFDTIIGREETESINKLISHGFDECIVSSGAVQHDEYHLGGAG
jgi:hypothetical protein